MRRPGRDGRRRRSGLVVVVVVVVVMEGVMDGTTGVRRLPAKLGRKAAMAWTRLTSAEPKA